MIKYYYGKLDDKKVITVCLIQKEDRIARGVAVLGDGDQMNRKLGRTISSGRAEKALQKRGDFGLVRRSYPRSLIRTTLNLPHYYKSAYMPVLTKFEQKLLNP